MSINKLFIVSAFLMIPWVSHTQEICDNGIDDDHDMLIDWKDTTDCPCGFSQEQSPIYYVPNVFSPDGDERNNEFEPVFTCGFDVLNYELIVYNRRGDEIFMSMNHKIGWDGTVNGTPVQQGLYPWTIRYKSSYTDETILLKGHVGLLR